MLTDKAIKSAKPGKHADGKGLTLLVEQSGGRLWRFRYRFAGREKMLSLGSYPDTGLKLARDKLDAARKLLAAGIDPSADRKAEKAALADTFEAVAEEWLAKQNYSAATKSKARWVLDELLLPTLGREPTHTITAHTVLRALQAIEARGHRESAHRARQKAGQILRYAVATGRAERDVTTDLRGALAPVETTSRAAITEPKAFGVLLKALDAYPGQFVTRQYLRILARVVTRPGELRQAQWSEIAADRLVIPADRMKMRRDHVVPLAPQVIAMLDELRPLTEQSGLVFPGLRKGRPISDAVPSLALKTIGYAADVHTAHGFRSSFSTMMHEGGHDSALIELCLAHADANEVRAIYNRSERLDERAALMKAWADYCDELRA